MKRFEHDSMKDVLSNIQVGINDLISKSNSNATSLYNTLYRSSTDVQAVKKKVAVLGDMMTDLNVISGKTKTVVNLQDLDVVSSSGVVVKEGEITLDKIKGVLVEPAIETSLIISDKPYTITDETGRSKTLEEVFKYNSPSIFKVANVNYDYTFVLSFSKINKVNCLTLDLSSIASSYPLIESIKVLSKDGITMLPVKILNNNSYNYSLDENRVLGNKYEIDIETVDTREIRVQLSSKTDSNLKISSIRPYFNTYEKEGTIIFGPIISDTPILKLGLSCVESSDNAFLEVSTDMETWIDVVDSFRVSTDSVRKVVAFNTINEASFKSTEEIKRLFVRVTLLSKQIENLLTETNSYDNYREDGTVSIQPTTDEAQNRFSAFRVMTDDLYYGGHTYNTGLEIGKKVRTNLETIMLNGETKVKGFDDTAFSIGLTDNMYNNVDIKLKHLRLPAKSDIDASTFDSVGSTLYDINVVPIEDTINVLSKTDICFKLTQKEDNYKLVLNKSKRYLDLPVSSNFISDSSTLLVQVPFEDVILMDSLGGVVHQYKKEELLKITKNEEEVFFISLINILYEPTSITGYSYNSLYPLVMNTPNEFGLENGRLVLGKGAIVKVKGNRVIKTKVKNSLEISYQNGNIWKRLDPLYTYHHEQIDTRPVETTVIKLDHRSLQKGSLKIYEYNAYETIGNEDNNYIAVANAYMKDNSYITEEINSDTYIKE